MGVKRTGTIFDNHQKNFLRNPLFFFELIGKPLYWFLASTLLIGLHFALLIGRITSSSLRFFFSFPVIIARSLTSAGLTLVKIISRILFLILRLFTTGGQFFITAIGRRLFSLKISFPRPRLPSVKFPSIKPPSLEPFFRILTWKVPRPGTKAIITSGILFIILTSSFLTFNLILKDLPHPERLLTREQIVSTKIYDRHGQLLYKIYHDQNRTLVPLSKIPVHVVQATIAIEDAEFYRHHGFSFKGIVRALFKNLQGDKLYGGSTITQQLVKNALLNPERTIKRKIKEVLLALWAEQRFSKDEILQMYLNEVGYGGAAYGIEEAAQMYFGKSARDLDLAETALLAGLPASPTTYSPFGAHPEKAKERQTLVLKRMTEEGFITKQESEKAREQELAFAPQKIDIKAPHFVMYVKEILVEKYGLRMVEEGGLEVITSLDLDIQNEVQEIVTQEINQLRKLKINNGAALATNPQTGEILAMVGSQNYFDLENDGNVNVTLRPRQPGSAIKPVNYSIALENGFTSTTIIPDTPITYQVPGQPPYSPQNYDNRFHGNVPLRVALASSYNVPAVKVLSALGVDRMIKRGQEMGITTWDSPSRFGLSLTLGGGEVKMVDMAVVYGTLANMGKKVDLNPILIVKNYKGRTLEKLTIKDSEIKGKQVISPQVAYILTDILTDNRARTPAFGSNSILNIPDHSHVAVKTGTTQNMRDNWTIGYTPDYVVAAWVGNNDNTPMAYVASGVTGASPIWNKIMNFLLESVPDKEFLQPENLVKVEVCPLTGTLPCTGCGGQEEFFLPGTEPKYHCQPDKIKQISEKKEKNES